MRLTSLADYAVLMMRTAAVNCGGQRTSAADLAAETCIPVPTAQKLAGLLGRAGLLKATRGSGGGIKLARPAAAINLADIIEAVEGPIALTACLDSSGHGCGLEQCCALRPHWSGVNIVVRDALSRVSLASLISETPPSFLLAGAGSPMTMEAHA